VKLNKLFKMDDDFLYAVFDEYDKKLRGGFTSEAAAWKWFDKHPPIVVSNGDEEILRLPTAFEADLVFGDHPEYTRSPASRREYKVALDIPLT
jgi:hypothetical protein